jgi:hypothetical protein
MTPERFAHLANAYGADLQRWPSTEQADAQALLARGDANALDALHQARMLDSLLDSHQVAAPNPGLAQQIAASATYTAPTPFWLRYAGWLSPAGFIGAALAGIAAGMLVASLSLPLSAPETLPSFLDHSDADIVFSMNAEENEQ